MPARPTLTRILAPTSVETFESTIFEREMLHVARRDAAYHAGVFDVAELEDILAVGARERDRFALIRTGEPALALDVFSLERRAARARDTLKPAVNAIDPRVISVAFAQGYTLLVKDAAAFSARLGRLCLALQTEFGFPVQANVYFTPPSAQGFDLHHDTHDTLILQIEGTKTWSVYEPAVELPLESQPFSAASHGKNPKLIREVTLQAGDTLYLPRGFMHNGATSAERSLHVTLALLPTRAIDVVDAMLRFIALADPELRRALPFDWATDPDFPQTFAKFVTERLAGAWNPGRAHGARILALQEMFAATRVDVRGAFDAIAKLAAANENTVFRLAGSVPAVAITGNPPTVYVAGKTLTFPAECADALQRLVRGPATFAELAALFPNGDAGPFITTLAAEGVLVTD